MPGLDRRSRSRSSSTTWPADAQATAAAAAALAPPSPADGLDQVRHRCSVDRAVGRGRDPRPPSTACSGWRRCRCRAAAPGSTPAGSAAGTLLPADRGGGPAEPGPAAPWPQADQPTPACAAPLRLAPGNAALPALGVGARPHSCGPPGRCRPWWPTLTASATLAAVTAVQLLSVHLTPGRRPTARDPTAPPGAPGAVGPPCPILPPTTPLTVDAVVANHGNVGRAPGLVVSAAAASRRGAGTPGVGTGRVALAPGGVGGRGPARPARSPRGDLRAVGVGEPAARPGRPAAISAASYRSGSPRPRPPTTTTTTVPRPPRPGRRRPPTTGPRPPAEPARGRSRPADRPP